MVHGERNEHTIARSVCVSGRGYWSGEGVNVRFLPGLPGTGIRFVRADLSCRPEIPVAMTSRVSHPLRTLLHCSGVAVAMVEHVLAALHGLQIDNCVVEVDREEMPGLDGSSAGFVAALRTAGLVMQASRRARLVVDRVCRVGDAENWVEVAPTSANCMEVEYRLDYGSGSPIPKQNYRCQVTVDSFVRELAPARTFVTEEQATILRSRGVAAHVTNRDLLVFGKDGPVGNLLRYHDECSRHKALDLVGDLSIVGVDIVGSIVSYRGGHQLNGALAVELERMLHESAGCRRAA